MVAKLSVICTRQSNGAYVAVCPDVKGCFTQGDSYEEAISNIKELVEEIIKEDLTEDEKNDLMLAETKIFSELEIVM